ncbi:periplasmic heavy metal sensor [Terricaulis sp.]|uniref:periplasmic heavy metal sensor n=1 Tax=Terricaulis sp. TaxID=2768686 RepID=UPI002AC53D05|nr:periplasmic heavy metal sensor [Terricaulis sp.]MDZ4691518.1 periplasmic heavy metal sensor [Terricaulis sp.]
MSASGFPLRTALFVSVAINLILISIATGAFLSGARLERPAPDAVHDAPLARMAAARTFIQALPPEARRELRRGLAGSLLDMRDHRRASQRARLALYDAAGAEPYDVVRVRAAFADVRAADAQLAASFQDSVAEALGRLSAEDRRQALDAMMRRQQRGNAREGRNSE